MQNKEHLDRQFLPKELVFYLSTRCNLNCSYCCVINKNSAPLLLKEKHYKPAIDCLFSFPGRNKIISFSGGEPLLEYDLLKKIFTYANFAAKRKNIKLTAVISTNGTLLTPEKIDFLEKNGIFLKISIDGGKKSHNKNRVFGNDVDKSSFDIIIKNIDNIRNRVALMNRVSIAMVFTPETAGDLFENVKFLQSRDFSEIGFIYEMFGDWSEKNLRMFDEQLGKTSEFYLNLFRSGFGKKLFKFNLIESCQKYNLKQSGVAPEIGCPKIILGPEGAYYPCGGVFSLTESERKKYLIGSAKSGLDAGRRTELLKEKGELIMRFSGQNKKYFPFCPIAFYFTFRGAKNRIKDPRRYFGINQKIGKICFKRASFIINKLKYNPQFINLYKN